MTRARKSAPRRESKVGRHQRKAAGKPSATDDGEGGRLGPPPPGIASALRNFEGIALPAPLALVRLSESLAPILKTLRRLHADIREFQERDRSQRVQRFKRGVLARTRDPETLAEHYGEAKAAALRERAIRREIGARLRDFQQELERHQEALADTRYKRRKAAHARHEQLRPYREQVKAYWNRWQEGGLEDRIKTVEQFATKVQEVIGDKVTIETVRRWCTQWKKAAGATSPALTSSARRGRRRR
jgi:hypothetical protein